MNPRTWKFRTTQFACLTSDEQIDFLRNGCSAKFAKWAYLNVTLDQEARISALRNIAYDERAQWRKSFLLQEVVKHKESEFGDWIVLIVSEGFLCCNEDIGFFITLYDDSRAHLATRGCCLFALSYIVEGEKFRRCFAKSQDLVEVCSRALYDAENPYARAGAVWLAAQLEIFGDRCQELLHDEAVCHGYWTVSKYAEMVLEK